MRCAKLFPSMVDVVPEGAHGLARVDYFMVDEMASRIQIFAPDDKTGDGAIPTLCVAEELHRQKNLKLYRTWTGKLRKRKGQIVVISTAGEPGSEFEQTRMRIRESSPTVERRPCFIRAASAQVVLHDYHVPDKADVEDMQVVKNANPASWITVETLREKRHSLTMTLGHWKRFTCDQATRDEASAITESEWSAIAVRTRIPPGDPIWLGLDVGWKWDTSAGVPLWVGDDGRRLLGPAAVLVPPQDGTSLKPDALKKALKDIHRRNPIHTVVMDMTRAEELAHWIPDELGAAVIDHSQSNAQAAVDYERFMEAMRTGVLAHSGDLGLARHVLNAVARQLPDGKTRFERPRSTRQAVGQERRVIDALTAAAMVNSEVASQRSQPSVYEKRGIRQLG